VNGFNPEHLQQSPLEPIPKPIFGDFVLVLRSGPEAASALGSEGAQPSPDAVAPKGFGMGS
jgi:hypothetical protein